MSKDANNVIRIPSNLKTNFFRYWVEFLTPIHHLNNKEKDVLAILIKNKFELSQRTNDAEIINKMLFDRDLANENAKQIGMSKVFYKAVISSLRSKGIIENKTEINKKLLPKALNPDDNSCKLLLYFDLSARDN